MTKIKLCGLSSTQDIKAANRLTPDYIGFVFAEKSKRYITPKKASALKQQLDPSIKAVGVFVNEKIDTVDYFTEVVRRDVGSHTNGDTN